MTTTPEPPFGVVLHTTTGPTPVTTTYAGVRDDGLHVWHADTLIPLGRVLHITADHLPAKTILSFLARETS